MKRLTLYSAIAIFIITTIVLSGCSDNKPNPLRLGSNVWLGYEPLFLARSLGYLKPDEVKLVEFMSASEVMRAFTNQSLDAAAITLDEALSLLEQGVDISIVLVLDISNGADVILSKPSIKEMQSLAGKRIGVEGSSLGAYILTRALDLNHLSLEEIEIVQLEANEHEKAYKDGFIDAVVTFEPTRAKLLGLGARELFSSKEIPNEVVDVLVVCNCILAQQKSHVEKAINSWFRALDYIHNTPEDAIQRMTARLKTTPEEIFHGLNGIHFPNREENIQLITGSNPTLLPSTQRLQKVMLANKLLQNKTPLDELFKESPPGLTH